MQCSRSKVHALSGDPFPARICRSTILPWSDFHAIKLLHTRRDDKEDLVVLLGKLTSLDPGRPKMFAGSK